MTSIFQGVTLVCAGMPTGARQAISRQGISSTRATGASDLLQLDTNVLELKDGDLFLLCSDGLTNEVNDSEIATELVRGNCQQTADNLLECALTRGARDNVTLIVLRADDFLHATETVLNPLTAQDH